MTKLYKVFIFAFQRADPVARAEQATDSKHTPPRASAYDNAGAMDLSTGRNTKPAVAPVCESENSDSDSDSESDAEDELPKKAD